MAQLSWDNARSRRLRWARTVSAFAFMLVPVVAFVAGWLAHRLPWSLITSPRPECATWAVVTSLAVCVGALIWYAVEAAGSAEGFDTELAFGAGTVALSVLAGTSAASSLFAWLPLFDAATMHDSGPSRFFWVAAFLGIALVFIAHDWTRRYLIVAAAIAALALGALVVRAGYEDPRIPDKVTRAAVVEKARTQQAQLAEEDQAAVDKVKATAHAARQTLAAELTARPSLAVSTELRAAAEAIVASDAAKPVNNGLVQVFDARRLHEPDSGEPAATQLAADVHALVTAQGAAAQAVPTDPKRLVAATKRAEAAAHSGAGWERAADDLALELAGYRAAVTGSPEDAAAYRALSAEQPTSKRVSLLDALTDGPEALWTSATNGHARPLVPGPLGWVLIGALGLWFWTWLLKVNARQLAGPVKISTASSGESEPLTSVLRVAVLSNVEEPGTTPGGAVQNPVTDLISVVGAGPVGTIGKVLELVLKIAGRQYGYDVTMDVISPKSDGAEAKDNVKASDDRVTVLVRVRGITDSQTVATHVHTAETPEKAVQAAGLWAAGFVLKRSSRIPTWAEWEAETAAALASGEGEGVPLASYEAAVRQAPRSGVLLVKTGHQYELAGQPDKAIALYARAVAAHPSYRVARYRLGAALTTFGDAANASWAKMTVPDRAALLRGIETAADALNVNIKDYVPSVQNEPGSSPKPGPASKPPSAAEQLNNIGRCLLEHLLVENRPHHRLVLSLRRSERDTWLPSPRTGLLTPAGRLHRIVYSAFMASATPPDADKLKKYASKPRQWWQASYNAACGLASMGDHVDDALTMLEQALLQPGIHQLDADWVRGDADLSSLRDEKRFDVFIKQLPGGV